MKLTKDNAATIAPPPGKADHIFWADDLPGFGLRVRNGNRTWIAQYRVNGETRRLKIGTAPLVTYAAAWKKAKRELSKAELGEDPQEAKRQARRAAKETLGDKVPVYLAHKAGSLRARSHENATLHLTKHWRPLHRLALQEITRRDIAARLAELKIESGPVSAARSYAALSGFFSWAIGEGLIDANPIVGVNRPAEPEARSRVLTAAELREVWNGCRDDDYGRIVKLLLLTGARRDEIGGLRWREVDIDNAAIRLPGDRTKNGEPHTMPLCPLALDIIKALPRRESREYLFGDGAQGFGGWTKAKAALDARILEARRSHDPEAQAMAEWRQHDLRRTMATVMHDALGVLPHIVESLLNHISGHKAGVAGVYNRAAYDRPKRDAQLLWSEHVRAIVEDGERKVIPLRAVQ